MHKVCKNKVGHKVSFILARTYTRQVAKNYAGKQANELARRWKKVCMKNVNELNLKIMQEKCQTSTQNVRKKKEASYWESVEK